MMTGLQEGALQVVKAKVGSLIRPVLEVMQCHFCHILSIKVSHRQLRIRGRDHKLHLLMEEWQDHITKELLGGGLLLWSSPETQFTTDVHIKINLGPMKSPGTWQRQTPNHFCSSGLIRVPWYTNLVENVVVIKNYKLHRETGHKYSREQNWHTVTWNNGRRWKRFRNKHD